MRSMCVAGEAITTASLSERTNMIGGEPKSGGRHLLGCRWKWVGSSRGLNLKGGLCIPKRYHYGPQMSRQLLRFDEAHVLCNET